MATEAVPLTTGVGVPAAGPGNVTVTPPGIVGWYLAAGLGATTPPAAFHRLEVEVDRSMEVPAGENLYLVGETGALAAVTRDAAPA